MNLTELQQKIEQLSGLSSEEINLHRDTAVNALFRLRLALNKAEVRAAESDPGSASGWKVNAWVKQGILLGFRLGRLHEIHAPHDWHFFDKDTVPLHIFRVEDNVRIVPGGSTVRDGTFL